MSNPFERKFREFATNLSEKNAQGHAESIAAKSGDTFADKPFSQEYKTIYQATQWGQSLAQVVTYATTAALGVFALTHIIPTSWGVYVAVPIALLFAYGVEHIKRSTLAIASKHLLKYKTFGFVGIVALLVMCVSIAAALYGAKELPGVVYAKPTRQVDGAAIDLLNKDIDRVQADIDRTSTSLKDGKNWTAENRTLPRLQKQRAALVDKRDQAQKEAAGRGDNDMNQALQERAEKVDKMQTYSVGAAIVAELVFLLCTAFILYYLFRHYAEINPDNSEAAQDPQRNEQGNEAVKQTFNGSNVAASNLRNKPDVVYYTAPANGATPTPARADDYRNTVNPALTTIVDDTRRTCQHCGKAYTYKHSKQKFCTETCRVAAWELQHGKELKRTKKNTSG